MEREHARVPFRILLEDRRNEEEAKGWDRIQPEACIRQLWKCSSRVEEEIEAIKVWPRMDLERCGVDKKEKQTVAEKEGDVLAAIDCDLPRLSLLQKSP